MTEPASTGLVGALGIKVSIFIAQLFGNLITLSFMAPMPWVQKVSTVIAGIISAHYVTRGVIWWFPRGEAIEDVIAFIIGLFVMALVKAVFDAIPATIKLIGEQLSRRLP